MARAKNKIVVYSFVILAAAIVIALYLFNRPQTRPYKFELKGYTQGTNYTVLYNSTINKSYQKEVDSLLLLYTEALSTYIPYSEISIFNDQDSFKFKSPFFYKALKKAREVNRETNGAFDPTVMPLVQAYGFGPTPLLKMPQVNLDSLLNYVDFNKIVFDSVSVKKKNSKIKLDFTAVVRGQAVDVVSEYLEEKGIQNYKVEIGGEIKCKGKSINNVPWKIVINKKPENDEFVSRPSTLLLKNKAIASAGSYQKFYVKDGQRRSHTINPKTGELVNHSLLSVSVVAKDCLTADAFATAFMVLGLEKSLKFLKNHGELDGYFVYSDDNGNFKVYMTEGVKKIMTDKK